MSGYSKEKADDMIEEHKEKADKLEEEANEMAESETFNRTGSKEKRDEAQEERDKADNLRELKKHHGDG